MKECPPEHILVVVVVVIIVVVRWGDNGNSGGSLYRIFTSVDIYIYIYIYDILTGKLRFI